MLVDLDGESRSVRLDDDGLAGLLAAAADRRGATHPDLEIALASGALDAALGTVAAPVVRLSLVVAGSAVRLEHRGWLGRETLALLLGVRPGLHQLMTLDPAFLTASLVRLTRMRPRRNGQPTGADLDTERLTDLVAEDPGARRAGLARVGADLAWDLRLTWAGGGRHLVAVDGPGGIRLADPVTGALRPASNTFVYRVLTTVLPSDDELAAGSAVAAPLHD
ncbi:MAG: hypothetical protein JWN22_3683 [Nocardioides sp.]|jgi:hypothetical protein|nr:hypothetical protein [Nocardioides sp.]